MSDEPHQVRQLFAAEQPRAPTINANFVETARSIAAICAVRILLLIAVVTGSMLWGFTIYDPERDRLYAAVAFSLVFVLPQVALFWKRG